MRSPCFAFAIDAKLASIVASVSAWPAVERTRAAEAQLSRAEAAILVAVEGVGKIAEQVEALKTVRFPLAWPARC